mmetsp:Transcript_16500/g.28019  ORF Transcript_16500/g.28019 Transcript_16500/m.28019 type:complete len:311 (-) Transcript_16500:456-1388(-)
MNGRVRGHSLEGPPPGRSVFLLDLVGHGVGVGLVELLVHLLLELLLVLPLLVVGHAANNLLELEDLVGHLVVLLLDLLLPHVADPSQEAVLGHLVEDSDPQGVEQQKGGGRAGQVDGGLESGEQPKNNGDLALLDGLPYLSLLDGAHSLLVPDLVPHLQHEQLLHLSVVDHVLQVEAPQILELLEELGKVLWEGHGLLNKGVVLVLGTHLLPHLLHLAREILLVVDAGAIDVEGQGGHLQLNYLVLLLLLGEDPRIKHDLDLLAFSLHLLLLLLRTVLLFEDHLLDLLGNLVEFKAPKELLQFLLLGQGG